MTEFSWDSVSAVGLQEECFRLLFSRPSVLYISRAFDEFNQAIGDATKEGIYIPNSGNSDTDVAEPTYLTFSC